MTRLGRTKQEIARNRGPAAMAHGEMAGGRSRHGRDSRTAEPEVRWAGAVVGAVYQWHSAVVHDSDAWAVHLERPRRFVVDFMTEITTADLALGLVNWPFKEPSTWPTGA